MCGSNDFIDSKEINIFITNGKPVLILTNEMKYLTYPFNS